MPYMSMAKGLATASSKSYSCFYTSKTKNNRSKVASS